MCLTEWLPPTFHTPAHYFGSYVVKHMIHLKPMSCLNLNHTSKNIEHLLMSPMNTESGTRMEESLLFL